MSDARALFANHIEAVCRAVDEALAHARDAGVELPGILFHSGSAQPYHADDQCPPFRTVPHFARYAPLPGPEHVVRYAPGERPLLVRRVTRDFWEAPPPDLDHPYREVLEVREAADLAELRRELGDVAGFALIGNSPALAGELGARYEPAELLAPLDWLRGTKTPYEVECIREAARRAGRGYQAVRRGVAAARSERQLFADWLEATEGLESEEPYASIIAWDEAAATLHYTTRRASAPDPGRVLLIDAGSTHLGYASDATRTYLRDDVHPVFRALHGGLEELQRDLCRRVRPGAPYLDLHERAEAGISALLVACGVITTGEEEARARRLAAAFFPHGLGHFLGLQVHDVGGRQRAITGGELPPPDHAPFLRTTRTLEAGHVVTVEPGIYFIPMLLEPLREREPGAFAWSLIDELVPHGGMRIEDDMLVTNGEPEDLTTAVTPRS